MELILLSFWLSSTHDVPMVHVFDNQRNKKACINLCLFVKYFLYSNNLNV